MLLQYREIYFQKISHFFFISSFFFIYFCKSCPKKGWYRGEHDNVKECIQCVIGETSLRESMACVGCSEGSFGSTPGVCTGCKDGQYTDVKKLLKCKVCENGQVVGSRSVCQKCRLGKHGSMNGVCISCEKDKISNQEGQSECVPCDAGSLPNNASTGCEIPTWKTHLDCKYESEYFNDTDMNVFNHDCVACPLGAWCKDQQSVKVRSAAQVHPKSGYWRVPWSVKNNLSLIFVKCPYSKDCLGYSDVINIISDDDDDDDDSGDGTNNDKVKNIDLLVDPCLMGTSGPLCSVCLQGYNRNVRTCVQCPERAFAVRVGVLLGILFLLICLFVYFRKKIATKWRKYRSLSRDLLRVFSINITFAQINSSMTSVVEIQWPVNWHYFVSHFNFVNIDVMSLVGANCISDFSYYASFLIMVCLPFLIIIATALGYTFSVAASKLKMFRLTNQEETELHIEALHKLFELADSDHSGEIDTFELVDIMKQLGWKISLDASIELCTAMGVKTNKRGALLIPENVFVNIAGSGKLSKLVAKMEKDSKDNGKHRIRRRTSTFGTTNKNRALVGKIQLIEWITRRHIISSSLSGATQLLLLAHTPVSRKVFQYFQCSDIGGKSLLMADYEINCTSETYITFMPIVLSVLILFTIALPATLTFYLAYHRNELYASEVQEKIGWMYSPFVRGAEFWQVHDVMLKMILTGLLIYVPATSRAGIAAFVCVFAIANLNYFQPHKNKVLFWLTQLSFLTTCAKYVTALLLSSQKANRIDKEWIGWLLICLDVVFMSLSVIAVPMAVCILKSRFDKSHKEDSDTAAAAGEMGLEMVRVFELQHAEHHANALERIKGRKLFAKARVALRVKKRALQKKTFILPVPSISLHSEEKN